MQAKNGSHSSAPTLSTLNKPQVHGKLCSSCGICVVACPLSCIHLKPGGHAVADALVPVIADRCSACGACVAVCPSLALSL